MQYKLKSVYWEAHGNINTYTAVLVFTARRGTAQNKIRIFSRREILQSIAKYRLIKSTYNNR
jgi:hypothetical protein